MNASPPALVTYLNRDVSWLSFNHRVLMEAANPAVPIYERVRFLGIFSSNLDEFFRVRMSPLLAADVRHTAENDENDPALLPTIQAMVQRSQREFGRLIVEEVLPELGRQGIHLYYGEPLRAEHEAAVTDFFFSTVLAYLQPIRLDAGLAAPLDLPDNSLYLAVLLRDSGVNSRFALLNIPHQKLPRFLVLPPAGGSQHLVFLDDIIRQHLTALFPGETVSGCFSIKINRNADVRIDDEFSGAMDANISQMLDDRKGGRTTRFLYDPAMPAEVLDALTSAFALLPGALVPGGRYHNLSSLMKLPNPLGAALSYPPQPPHPVAALQGETSIFERIDQRDYLLHLPYHSYSPVLRFFNEAATHPDVTEVAITLYRVAADSAIAEALSSAARNGKRVTVFVELKARFDEANNLHWGKRLEAAGVRLVYSIPGLKVHAKVALVTLRRGGEARRVGLLATGNFNETTARFYTDHVLLTSHVGITADLDGLFSYLQSRQQPQEFPDLRFQHLLVAQFNLVPQFLALIDREIRNHRAGLPARITIKLNNFQEKTMVDKLYEASQAGVPIDLLVRAICTLVPGVPGLSPTIRVRRIVDRYLEHGRVFVFHNGGQPETYLGSADWMNRNLNRRIEVCFPIYDPDLQQEIERYLALQFADTVQASRLTAAQEWEPVNGAGPAVHSQRAIYAWLRQAIG